MTQVTRERSGVLAGHFADGRGHDTDMTCCEPPCTQRDDDGCGDDADLGRCDACGYVFHDIPRDSDDAHGELCCGSAEDCASPDLCITHDAFIA